MKNSSPWCALLIVAFWSLVLSSPFRADDGKDASLVQSPVFDLESAPLDGLDSKYQNTRQISAIPHGLIGWWTADADALDSLGLNSGRLRGNVTYVPGMVGQAFHLDGKMSYVKVATTDLTPERVLGSLWTCGLKLMTCRNYNPWLGGEQYCRCQLMD